jgi:uncharacterized protein (DUF2267 family)
VETAERRAAAVFLVLRQAIGDDEFADLAAQLPVQLHQPLHRGAESPQPRLTAREFVLRVAERADIDIDIDRAVREIPAVFTILRTYVGDEFFDISVQLPGDYWALLGTRTARQGSSAGGTRR